MAEVTERDRKAALSIAANEEIYDEIYREADPVVLTTYLAAFRESCVAESEAARQTMAVAMQEAIDREVDARLKAEGERDEALARVRKWERHEIVKASCCDDNEQRAIKAEAHLREFEQHEAETHASLGAILGTDTSLLDGAKRMQARLRAVIEAADKVWSLAKTLGLLHPDLLDIAAACNAYRRVRDAQASPEPDLPWSQHGGRDGR